MTSNPNACSTLMTFSSSKRSTATTTTMTSNPNPNARARPRVVFFGVSASLFLDGEPSLRHVTSCGKTTDDDDARGGGKEREERVAQIKHTLGGGRWSRGKKEKGEGERTWRERNGGFCARERERVQGESARDEARRRRAPDDARGVDCDSTERKTKGSCAEDALRELLMAGVSITGGERQRNDSY